MYLNDSVGMKMYAFDFDLETGGLSNQRVLVDSAQLEGEPDGMVVEYGLLEMWLTSDSY